ncbi:MAG TPA: radical SAM protein [Nitrospirae bacterium]|nr:cyclic pyranopterin monophosphate synthase [bacterium BMS3Abin06]HDH12902.1 radical SAM protein [Nitrospirota bacterium]HDZ01686.1 radical SAM protein [Nitrospirota bacterium]
MLNEKEQQSPVDLGGDWNKFNGLVAGKSYFFKSKIRRALRDYWNFHYLLKHFDYKSAYNLFYTRTLVPTGEGSQRWFYHLGLQKYLMKYPDRVPVPRFFEMETTTICNKKCFICEHTHWTEGTQEIRHITLEEFKHVANQFPNVRWVNLTGEGSSFLNNDFIPMIKYLRNNFKTSVWLVDHLSDITHEKLKELQTLIHGIYISIDGATKGTYEFIKEGCDFDKVVNNIKYLLQLKRERNSPFPNIHFRYVIIKENVNEIPQFLDLINSMGKPWEWGGVAGVEFAGLLYFPTVDNHYVRNIPGDLAEELKKRKNGIFFRFDHVVEDMNPPIDCCLAWMEPYIMLPGYVIPCCGVLMSNNRQHLRDYSFGNVFEKDFKEIWKSDYYSKFRRMVVTPDAPVPRVCSECRGYQTKHRIEKYGIWDERAT